MGSYMSILITLSSTETDILVGIAAGFSVLVLWNIRNILIDLIKKWLPQNQESRTKLRISNELHATKLKAEFELHADKDDKGNFYQELLIRDGAKKLHKTNETHSSKFSPKAITYLTDVDSEGIEVCIGIGGIRWIKQIDDDWYYANEQEDDAIRVETIWRIDYKKISSVNWDSNKYWQWPLVSCHVDRKSKNLYSKDFLAQEFPIGEKTKYIEKCQVECVKPKLQV